MNFVVDIGNTLQKFALFDSDDNLIFVKAVDEISIDEIALLFEKQKITNSIISTVAQLNPKLVDFLQKSSNSIIFNKKLKLPITIQYEDLDSLGTDRIANAAGATVYFPNQNCLSIQLGTCIVYDFVDKHSVYHGGAISPGINMRFRGLHQQTHNLPLINKEEINYFIGKTTEQSIKSGVMNGVLYEIDGQIDAYNAHFDNLKVLITGGDHSFLQNSIKNQIFAVSNLVLIGLNKILTMNV